MGRQLDQLIPTTRWLGHHRSYLAETDSTNLRAEEQAEAGAPDGTLVYADRQTAGRGRLGRSFHSPGGVGLYQSLVLRPRALPPEAAHQHVFAAAVGVARAVSSLRELADRVEIKWPNDVLIGGRKTCGISLSVRLSPAGSLAWMILGIGVNVNTRRDQFPAELRELATSLALECERELDRTEFAARLLLELEGEIDALRAGDFGGVLERWRGYFRWVGREVRVGVGTGPADRALEGRIEGIDSDGALLLHTHAGSQRIVAGDVTLLRRKV